MRLDNVEDVYALAPMQEGMLYHAVSEEGSGVFVTQVSANLQASPPDSGLAAFKRAWDRLVARHESLRTAFVWDGVDEPLQVVRARAELAWSEEDWRALDEPTQATRWADLLRADRAHGFDLSTVPLMRMTLARIAEREWRWAWSFHHLIADGWSTRLLLGELRELCAAERAGRAPGLGSPFHYRDYIAWLAKHDALRAEEFWRRELAGFTEPTGLDFVRPPVPGTTARACQTSLRLSAEASTALRSMAAERRVTLSTVLGGAWALLLARYSGAQEVVYGVTTSGRPPELEGIETAVGLFINTLPLRVAIEPRQRLDRWLTALQSRQIELLRWEASPLHAVQRWSEAPAGRPLFDSILVFENQPAGETGTGDAGFELHDLEFAEQSNYPLALLVLPDERLELLLAYDETRVDSGDAEQVVRQLEALLSSFVERPEEALQDQTMVSPAERVRVLVDWNSTARELPPPSVGIYRLFDEMARGEVDAPAVSCGTRTVSYRELARSAEQLAEHLRALGVGPEVLVGLFVERSVEMVVGLLGVLAANGAYVPLDPSHPAAHRRAVLDEASPRLVLTTRSLAGELAVDGIATVLLDEPGTWVTPVDGIPEAQARATRGERGDRLAYVIFTSGSAGRPKGVEVTNRNLVASTLARHRFYGRMTRSAEVGGGAVERFLLLSSFSFDSSVAGIFWTLLSGGHLVLPEPEAERDLDAVRKLIREHRITHMLCLPTFYEVLLAEAPAQELDSLRVAIVAGEACPASVAAAHHAALRGTRLFNEYGPTEATVWCSVHEVVPEDSLGPVPIGRPIANTRLYVLDDERRPVPVGVPGELYVAGEGVARGYLGQDRLTTEQFVTLRLEGVPEERAYRTGDLVRHRSDGSLLFLGRADSQVKIRGHRIETTEIEAMLRRHPDVAEAAVAARTPVGATSSKLFAWIVAQNVQVEGGAPDALERETLGAWLRARLPAFMTPGRFLVVDRLPRTPTGKVDYRALELPQPGPGGAFVAPRDETERAFAAVWEELLGIERVGVRDNFYELGGDSILGIQVVSRLRQAGYAVEPRHVAAHPTIAELAAAAGPPPSSGEVASRAQPLSGEIPLLPIQSWFFERDLTRPHHWNQSRLFAVEPDLDPERFTEALRHCLDHHDMLRARFEPAGEGGWRQIVAPPGEMPALLSVVDLATVAPDGRRAARSRRIAEAQASLDLAAGPLIRAVWFPAVPAGSEHSVGLLLLVVHHLVIDAASWAPLISDLWRAYEQLGAGEPVSLPARTASFGRWARRVAEEADCAGPAPESRYWLAAGTDAGIPVDLEPGRAPTEAEARTLGVALDRRRTEALAREVHDAYGTRTGDLLITALGRALCRWSGAASLRLALEGHGRPVDLDTSRTVGWFTVSYPVVLAIRVDDDLATAIKSVKEQLRRVPGDGSSYGILRHGADRDVAVLLRSQPEPQVLFNYLSRVDASGGAGALRPVEGADSTSRDPRNERSHVLEINAAIREGRLTADWIYCENVHRRETVARWSAAFVSELEALVDHCLREDVGGVTASDFPDAGLEGDDLEALLERLDPGEG